MTIFEITKQGLHYARTCKSLWIFGFIAGLASGGGPNFTFANRGPGAGSVAGLGGVPGSVIAMIVVGLVFMAIVAAVIRFISEGALIEGVVRARSGGRMTTREAFRAGRAHWGVLLRIALLYGFAMAASMLVLMLP